MFRLPVHAGIATLVALLLFTAQSHAAPFAYDESVSGDLPAVSPLPLLPFDLGANHVTGTVSITVGPPFPDFDSFAFNVPDGMFMTGGNIALTTLSGNFNNASWDLRTGILYNTGTLLGTLLSLSPGSVAIPAIPAGSYNMSAHQLGGSSGTGAYTFTFNVTPEPASLSSLALGVVPILRRSRPREEKP